MPIKLCSLIANSVLLFVGFHGMSGTQVFEMPRPDNCLVCSSSKLVKNQYNKRMNLDSMHLGICKSMNALGGRGRGNQPVDGNVIARIIAYQAVVKY